MKKAVVVWWLGGAAIILSGCGSAQSDSGNGNGNGYQQPRYTNTDPTQGWVAIGNESKKKCDGANMVYESTYDGSIAVAPNDPQCAPYATPTVTP